MLLRLEVTPELSQKTTRRVKTGIGYYITARGLQVIELNINTATYRKKEKKKCWIEHHFLLALLIPA